MTVPPSEEGGGCPSGQTEGETTTSYTTTYTYDANNRLISEVSNKSGNTVLTSYTYDDNGNLESQLDVDSSAAVHHSYNGFNQLVSSVTGEGTITYTYNAQGIRTSRTIGLTTTHYLLDGGNVIGEVEGDETYTYVRGINLIFGRARYYLYNAHGDVVQLTNTNGQLTKNYNYDAFGNERAPKEDDLNPFRYCGEYYDTETGLYYLRARYYDPLIGRFTQEDTHWNTANMIYGDNPQKINEREDKLGLKHYSYAPELLSILQAGNLYVYCINNPVNLGDCSGNKAQPLAFNEGVFSLLLIAVMSGVCIAVAIAINPPPPIPLEGKLVDITSKKPQEQAVVASPASPLPPDDDFGTGSKRKYTDKDFNAAKKDVMSNQNIHFETKEQAIEFIKKKFPSLQQELAGHRSAQGWHFDAHPVNGHSGIVEHINLYIKSSGIRIHIFWG